jgi:uridine kinase
MKTIVITGPSGSGKSFLTNTLSKLFNNSIVIRTDSYYKDNLLIRFISIFLYDIYDRPFSIKKNEIMKTIKSVHNKDSIISFYKYDFKRKNSLHSKISINYNESNQFLILEGIFAHRLDLNYQETINIVCEEQKELCFKRRLKRDLQERGRDRREVYKKFNKSWDLFNENIQSYLNNYKVMSINPLDMISYNKLVLKLKKQKNN